MNEDHLSAFEKDEYLLGERTPEMVRHLANCADCRAAVLRVEEGLASFRLAAIDWSEANASTRPWLMPSSTRFLPVTAMRWAITGVLPVLLMVLALLIFHAHKPQPEQAIPVASISDDALLDQVDDQVSVSVPSSMESLTHLVSAQGEIKSSSTARSKSFAETN